MKYVNLFETPHRFDEPEVTPAGKYPAHMAVALQFGKFIKQMGDRVRASTKSDHVKVDISKEHFTMAAYDVELIHAMKEWRKYDKNYPLSVRYFANPVALGNFIHHTMKDKEWPEAEPYLLTNAFAAFSYQSLSLKRRRWPVLEPLIVQHPQCSVLYAHRTLDREWPEAEPYIMESSEWACTYAICVRKRRWPEIEWIIWRDQTDWFRYSKHFNIKYNDKK